MEIEIGIIVLLLLLLTFLAVVDMAFGQLSDVGLSRLKAEAEDRPDTDAAFLTEILENRPRFRFTISAAVQICLVAFSSLATFAASKWFTGHKFLFVGVGSSLLLAGVFRQFIPRWTTLRNPEGVLLKTLPLVRPFYRLLTFAADPFHRKFDRMRAENETVTPNLETVETKAEDEEQLQAYLEVGAAEGIIEEDESELIYSIIEFGDTRVHEIMTPRTDIVALPITSSVRETRDVMIESKYSRLPVYKEKIDDIEGFVYMRDLLESWAGGAEKDSIAGLLRPLYFVPETKPVADLLEEMQKAHTQIAMVVDEYGGVAGLVTIEDMLEEIVGEIEDEDIEAEETNEIVEAGEGVYDVQGSVEIGKVEDLFDMEIEADDFTTTAGLVTNDLGRVPTVGEKFTLRGLDLEVLEADEKRIGLLRVGKAVAEAPAADN
jgi:CBS domain containing-hemolysin-like protein